MKIAKVLGREIFDSRGFPTIECQLFLENGFSVTASVPSGLSLSSYEAVDLRDGTKRFMGKGVTKAINNLESLIAPLLLGREPDVVILDQKMIELDGTDNKSKLGANAMLAASIALVKAQALNVQLEPFELIAQLCDTEMVTLPFPFFNMINGGVHADNNLRIQEFMVVPLGGKNFREAMECALHLFFTLKELLQKKKLGICVGDEGGFAPIFKNDMQALDLLMEAIDIVDGHDVFKIALDVAATQFFDPKTGHYDWHGKNYSADDLIALYKKLIDKYPIFSIEDGLQEKDWDGWQRMMKVLGKSVQIVGDDIFATNPERIWHGIEKKIANAAIIKPNQVGTITETLQAIQVCQESDIKTIVSHRSGETTDTFIADLAVGSNAGQFKAGGCCRGERMAKYNRILAIEDQLAFSLLES